METIVRDISLFLLHFVDPAGYTLDIIHHCAEHCPCACLDYYERHAFRLLICALRDYHCLIQIDVCSSHSPAGVCKVRSIWLSILITPHHILIEQRASSPCFETFPYRLAKHFRIPPRIF